MTQTYTITHNTRTKTTNKLKAHRNISEEDGMDDKSGWKYFEALRHTILQTETLKQWDTSQHWTI